jgi:hypothetical protein
VLDRKSDTPTFPELGGYLNPQESAGSNRCIDSDPPGLVQPLFFSSPAMIDGPILEPLQPNLRLSRETWPT